MSVNHPSQSAIRLLLMGGDEEMLGLLEDVLQEMGFTVETRHDLDSIDEVFDSFGPDLVLFDEADGKLDGERVYDTMIGVRGQKVSFIMLADDGQGKRIARCLDKGMSDVLMKPYDIDELAARIRKAANVALALEEESFVEDVSETTVGFRGHLEYLNLPDILMNLHQNVKTGKLEVQVPNGEYVFSFQDGDLVKVTGPRGLEGRKAFYRSMREDSGKFKFIVRDKVSRSRSYTFENLANLILQAVQEADEFPITRGELPEDPRPVKLTEKVESIRLPEQTAIQPLLEGLIQSTTIDILIHACPKTDLEAASELRDLMADDVLVELNSAEAAS